MVLFCLLLQYHNLSLNLEPDTEVETKSCILTCPQDLLRLISYPTQDRRMVAPLWDTIAPFTNYVNSVQACLELDLMEVFSPLTSLLSDVKLA